VVGAGGGASTAGVGTEELPLVVPPVVVVVVQQTGWAEQELF